MQSPHIKLRVLSLSPHRCGFSLCTQWNTIPITSCYFHFIQAELCFASRFCTVHRVKGGRGGRMSTKASLHDLSSSYSFHRVVLVLGLTRLKVACEKRLSNKNSRDGAAFHAW